MVDKPWGRDVLPPPFDAPGGRRIGEIWFEPPTALSELLVKYIFTSEALSVQVHPNDAQAEAAGLGRQGKEECWLIVSAEPGAQLGLGFGAPISAEAMRAAALDGSIEDLLTWFAVKPGDFFYIPANTVHAIGAGIGLIEVQQNSDVTYRIYDYGRPRELHLDAGIAVARRTPYADPRRRHLPAQGEVMLVNGPMFRLARYDGPVSARVAAIFAERPLLVIPQRIGAAVEGNVLAPGTCALAKSLDALRVDIGATGLIAQPL